MKIINNYKTYITVVLGLTAGILFMQGLIPEKIFEGALVLIGFGSVAGLRHAIKKSGGEK